MNIMKKAAHRAAFFCALFFLFLEGVGQNQVIGIAEQSHIEGALSPNPIAFAKVTR